MIIFDVLRSIKKRFLHYTPSVEVLISKSNLLNNFGEYRRNFPDISFAPVLKSNAYGHGLAEVAKILDKEKIAFFVLDSLYEAIVLKRNGVKSPLLIIGYTQPENIINSKLSDVSFVITSLDQLKEIAEKAKKKIKIHLKIDTGMHRQGIMVEEINEAVNIIKANNFFILEGVCSHFADADGDDPAFTNLQIEKWQNAVALLKANFESIKFFHISATSGVFYTKEIKNNVARLGIGLYGINPSLRVKLDLKPVLQMSSIISSVRDLKVGESVGYNATYTAKNNMKIATAPTGYFEGVDRRLSNQGFFKMRDIFCPIVGRVSMNITSIDVTNIPNTNLGEKVVIISNKKEDKNSAEKIAELANTIPYEILVHIPQSLRRVVID